ncbi:MAG: arginine deiminase family protein [Actinomycetota bacterium]|nr:arginine deiminase family protein [Actinomycetota bacterium]
MKDERASVGDVLPESYHQILFPPLPEPPFEARDERERVWGALWGANSEVGRLRAVLMRRPGPELERITADGWDEALGALVDAEEGWYWESDQPPDIQLVGEQYAGLVEMLAAEGVDVHFAEPVATTYSKAMYTRDPLVILPGGAVVGRLAPRMRRGEEQSVTRAVASLGMPILRTIVGTGLVEGGSFAKLTPEVAAFGTSIRCNDEGARQLEEIVRYFGIELVVVPMAGFSLHLDGALAMVDVDKALVHAGDLPYWFLARLPELGIEPIWCHPDELWAVNSLTISPGRVIMSDGYPYTAELLERRGVDVLRIPYGEIQKNGGGIHCSTIELIREDV